MNNVKNVRDERLDKLKKIKDLGIDPYPSKILLDGKHISISIALSSMGDEVLVAGRIMSIRSHGGVSFADLKDYSGNMQLFFQKKVLGEKYNLLKLIDSSDFIAVSGGVMKTVAGETSVLVSDLQILTKSIRQLPSVWYGLKDTEERYRQRYVDFLVNEDLKELFRKKSVFWNSFRNFLSNKGFLEVETPVLENTAGGADAQPFVTHHEALDIDLYLRISMGELWQKRLMVAGFEKTFEIGRQFRNEGLSREHLQDYTQMEFYWAYANYENSMALVEEMYKHVAQETFGKLNFEINGFEVDLDKKWEKIDYTQTIKDNTGVDISTATIKNLREKLGSLKVDFDMHDSLKKMDRVRLIDMLWKTVRKSISGPVFLVGHPVEISPLAKRMADSPKNVERYQVIIAGSEMGNGYSELNDPLDQAERFKEQQKLRDEGDVEAQMNDWDFVRALEYGMPPVSGFGVSERLFSFLADKPIKETVLFPLLRPEDVVIKEKYDYKAKKIVAIVNSQLPAGKIANALGHMAFSAGHYSDNSLMGKEKIIDLSGVSHQGISKYPFIVLQSTKEKIKVIAELARNLKVFVVDFPNEMFETADDNELVKELSKADNKNTIYQGVVLVGNSSAINNLTNGLQLYGK